MSNEGTEALSDAIMAKFTEMEEKLGEDQFAFVITYMFVREFRVKVYEEKKLTAALDQAMVQQDQIDVKFGDSECAMIIWEKLPQDRRDALLALSQEFDPIASLEAANAGQ